MMGLVEELYLFPNPKSWGVRLRRVLAPIEKHDATLIHKRLAWLMRPVEEACSGYRDKTRFAVSARS